jgi:hypothetical protein
VRGFVFDLGACMCQSIKCPSQGSGYRGGEPMGASSEAEIRPRGDQPSSEADLTRGGVQPSSEAELHARGRPALERGGTSPEGASSPRVRRGFVSATLCPSSEAEFRPRVAGPTVLVCRWGHQGRGPLPLGRNYFERVLGL